MDKLWENWNLSCEKNKITLGKQVDLKEEGQEVRQKVKVILCYLVIHIQYSI
jgi:hypothetical protein